MDLDKLTFEPLRPDANRFILGVLWLTAAGALAVSPESVRDALRFIDSAASLLGHVAVPPFIVGFLAVVAGVLMPYCLSEVFTPLAFLLMNVTLRIQRRFKPMDVKLVSLAHESVANDLASPVNPAHAGSVLYLTMCAPKLAGDLLRRRRQLEFRASAILPATILLGWFTYHLLEPAAPSWLARALAVVVGLLLFGSAVYQNNRDLGSLIFQVELAALAVAKNGGLARWWLPSTRS
jgi:hypothetical protein